MLIDKFDCEPYHIDGDILLKVSVNETHWLEATYDIYSEDWQITNLNTEKQYYVMMEGLNPVDCDCAYRIYNDEVCKHMLAIGYYLNTDNITTIDSTSNT